MDAARRKTNDVTRGGWRPVHRRRVNLPACPSRMGARRGAARRRRTNVYRHDVYRLEALAPDRCCDAEAASQEQIQMITNAIGRPAPNAPPISNANAESKFVSI